MGTSGGLMKTIVLLLVIVLLHLPALAHAAVYQWIDADGVTHFTDNPKKIPQQYKGKAKEFKLPEDPAQPKAQSREQPKANAKEQPKAQPTVQPAPPEAAPPELLPGGHPEQWWRRRFQALRGQLKALQAGVLEKQARLGQLRRKRAIYVRTTDREAVNAMQAKIASDELRINEVLKQIEALETEATQAGVPEEWRR